MRSIPITKIATITTPATATGIQPSPAASSDGDRSTAGGAVRGRRIEDVGGGRDRDQLHAPGRVLRQLSGVEERRRNGDTSPAPL